jgi:divinyl protochlorophyllide a 8-vinyl-reductase
MSHEAGRIGPNAIIRLAEALRAHAGDARAESIFRAAGQHRYLSVPPEEMVDEREVIALHAALRGALSPEAAAQVSAHAGRLTADYLLAHRIPRAVQSMLGFLPAPLAARVLVRAITGHAWTFAGSGEFSVDFATGAGGPPLRFAIRGCPICRGASSQAPLCDYYAATFEHLFRTLVRASASVSERECEARGAQACRFDVRW